MSMIPVPRVIARQGNAHVAVAALNVALVALAAAERSGPSTACIIQCDAPSIIWKGRLSYPRCRLLCWLWHACSGCSLTPECEQVRHVVVSPVAHEQKNRFECFAERR